VTGFLGSTDLAIIAGVLIVLVLVAARVLLRDSEVRRTRFGFFLERDRYHHDDEELVEGWKLDDTLELPPEKRDVPK
jgi:hypothetical protein